MLKFILLNSIIIGLHGTHGQQVQDRGRGTYIGQLNPPQHEVSGNVWAPDVDKLYIEDFTYDGEGPDAFFWISKNKASAPGPNADGQLVSYPCPSSAATPLTKFDKDDVVIHLPKGVNVTDMNWFSVWCREYAQNFGSVAIPVNLKPPQKAVLPEFKRLAHKLQSGNITILDARTFLIPDLYYDGKGPAAYFWVGNGMEPDANGQKIPDENGRLGVLKEYTGQTIVLRLPDNMTIYDIEYLGMWCVQFSQNFGHVQVPKSLLVPPALDSDCKDQGEDSNAASDLLGPRGLVAVLLFTSVFCYFF